MLVVALVTLGNPGRLTGGYLYHRRMADLAPRFDARIEFVSFPDWPFPLPIGAAPSVRRRVADIGARVVVLDSIAAAFWGLPIAGAPTTLPLVGMLHQPPGGIDHGPVRTAIQARLDRLAWNGTHLLMVASELLAQQLVAQDVPRTRLRVVPPGRDSASPAVDPPPDPRRGCQAALLCVGNWVERKGIHSLLEAMARLPERAAVLHLIGDDTVDPRYAARIRARLARPDLRGRVVVHGPLPAGEVAAWYAAADVFVLPSLVEPYGTVYGEAMAAGLPVVGWRSGNLPYLVDHEREGFLAPPGDVGALAAALRRLADDEPLRLEMGTAARARALMLPTWEQSAALFFAAIRECIG